ncbi:MAG: NAD(P)/FAD-dependent oxidoreductase [Salinirussus sp.]
MDARDVIVIGGGVIGCAVAWKLATTRDVLVIEKGQIGGEASGLAVGNVNPTLSYPDRPTVASHIRSWFRRYEDAQQVRFTRRPRLELVESGAMEAARDRATELRHRGRPVNFLGTETIESTWPVFDLEEYDGALCYGDTGWIDPHLYTQSLRCQASNRGAEFRTHTPVQAIESVNGHLQVRIPETSVRATYVVVAAGWRTRAVLDGLLDLPVRPFLTQCVSLRPASSLPANFPMGRDPSANLYFRGDRNGELLVGGGRRSSIDDPNRASTGIDAEPQFRRTVAQTLPKFLNGFDNASLVNGWAGVDGGTPDGHPIITAPSCGPDGLIVATGFHGGGIRDSPIAASLVQSIVLDEPVPFDRTAFSLSRFPSRSPDFSISKEYDPSTTT